MNETNDNSEKNYTVRSAQLAIVRLRKSIEENQTKMAQITEQLKADKESLRELEKIYEKLCRENLEKQILSVYKKMTVDQINKFLELSAEISDQLNYLDVIDIVNAVNSICEGNETDNKTDSSENNEEEDVN